MKDLIKLFPKILVFVLLIQLKLIGQVDIICNPCLISGNLDPNENKVISCLLSTINDKATIEKIRNYKTISPQSDGRMTATTIFDEYVLLDCNFDVAMQLNYDLVNDFSQGLASVRKNNLEGYIDWKGSEVIQCQYQSAMSFSEKYAAVKKDGKWGYINKDGEQLIALNYDDAGNFLNNLAVVQINNKYGVINNEGRTVLPLKYDRIDINYNKIFVRDGEKEGIYDAAGNNVVPVIYDYISIIRSNLAKVNSAEKSGIINLNGGMEYPLSSIDISVPDTNIVVFGLDSITTVINYLNNDTVIINRGQVSPLSKDYFIFKEGAKSGVINRQNEIVIKPDYEEIIRLNNNYIANNNNSTELYDPNFKLISRIYASVKAAGWKDALITTNGEKFGVIESSGQILIPFKYDVIEPFNSRLIKIYTGENCGLIDTNLNIVVPIIYNSSFEQYSDDRYLIKQNSEISNAENKNQAIIDSFGNYIIRDDNHIFSMPYNGMFRTEKDGKFGFYDINGNLVIPFIYNYAGDFHERLAYVSDSTNAYVDRSGNKKIDLGTSLELLNFAYNMGYSIILSKDSLFGLMKKNGQYLLPEKYDTITAFTEENLAFFSENKKLGIVDAYSGIIVQPKYDEIGLLNTNLFRVKLDGKYGFIGRNGKVIIPLIYDSAEEFVNNRSNVVLRGISFSIDSKGDVIPR